MAAALFCLAREAVVTAQDRLWQASVISDTVLPADDSQSKILRVGLRNTSGQPRLVCVIGWTYAVEHANYFNAPGEGSSHGCRDTAAFDLVLPEETTFFAVQVTAQDLQFGSAKLNVEVLVRDARYGVSGSPQLRTLKWSGTVEATLTASRRLIR
jgi:hypothetical protein